MESTKTHILVIPFPAQGHINPMLQFAKRLADKGPKVTLVTTTTVAKTSTESRTGSVHIVPISDGFLEGENTVEFDVFIKRFKVGFSQSLADFIEKQNINGDPVKALVYDSAMPWVLEIGHGLGLYGAPFFTQSGAAWAIYYHVHGGALKLPLKGSTVSLPSLPLLKINELPSFLHDLAPMSPAMLDFVLNQFSNLKEADCLFFNTFDKLEHGVVSWMKTQLPMIKAIGPTIPSMYLDQRLKDDNDYGLNLFTPSAKTCMEWLDNKEIGSVVYVSFGSLAKLGEEQMEELALGLKRIKSHFLWVVRGNEENKLPSNFMTDASEKGLIVNWCPQLEVLAHRAIGCFVTHCGWNSAMEALSLGVPIVAMPQWLDQTTNAKYIVDVWNVGVRVKVNKKGLAMREEIEKSITEVIEGERGNELRNIAIKWRELAKEAIDEGGSSDKNIDEFVSKVVCNEF